jgi:hypothetical protein
VYSGEAHVATLDVAGDPYHITVLEVLLVWFALAGNVTAVQRGTVAWRDLTKLQEEGSDVAPSEAVTVEVVEESTSREEEGEEGAESVEEEDTVEEEDGEIEEQEDLPKASKRG